MVFCVCAFALAGDGVQAVWAGRDVGCVVFQLCGRLWCTCATRKCFRVTVGELCVGFLVVSELLGFLDVSVLDEL